LKNFPVAARLKPTPPGRTLPFEPAAARAKTADSASSRNIFTFFLLQHIPMRSPGKIGVKITWKN
jgi:hypothetical protein